MKRYPLQTLVRRREHRTEAARQRVLVLPERDGRLLMLSPLWPHEALARLRGIAPAPVRG